jgi:hypothetical protein
VYPNYKNLNKKITIKRIKKKYYTKTQKNTKQKGRLKCLPVLEQN